MPKLTTRVFLLIWFTLVSIVLSGLPAAAQNVRITDYDVPISRADRFDIKGGMSLYGDDDGTQQTYSANGYWESFYYSLPYTRRVTVSAGLDVDKRTHNPATYYERISILAGIDKYVRDTGLLYGGISAKTSWDYDHDHVALQIDAAVGLGRLVDATALAKALRIEQFLIKENILRRCLPQEMILELASVIDREREYQKRYGDTYWVWWYADMEKAILGSGLVSGNNIGAVGLFRTREVLDREAVHRRSYGWKIETGIVGHLAQARSSDHKDLWPALSAAYSWPLSLANQLTISGRLAGATGGDFGKFFSIDGNISLTHEISNRIDLVISEEYKNVREKRIWRTSSLYHNRRNHLRLTFVFYLENQVSAHVYGGLSHYNSMHSSPNLPSPYRLANRNWRINARLVCRIL